MRRWQDIQTLRGRTWIIYNDSTQLFNEPRKKFGTRIDGSGKSYEDNNAVTDFHAPFIFIVDGT